MEALRELFVLCVAAGLLGLDSSSVISLWLIEYCGGIAIGGGFITESLLQPQVFSAFSTPAMGCNLFILDSSGNLLVSPQDSAGIGELALDPTLFGSSTTLLNVDHHEVYFSGMPEWNAKVLRGHGDEFERTTDGCYRAHGSCR